MNLSRDVHRKRVAVAVIGSGPAGLTVAGDLAAWSGFNVTIFEGQAEPGGVLMYGIPEYRLPSIVVRDEVAKIAALGVQFITHHGGREQCNHRQSVAVQATTPLCLWARSTSVPANMDSTPGSNFPRYDRGAHTFCIT